MSFDPALRQLLVHHYGLNLDYARRLTADLSAKQWTLQPAPHTNHAAWVIGHLAGTSDFTAGLLDGKSPSLPESWNATYGQTSQPTADASLYADGKTLLATLTKAHERLTQAFLSADEATLNQPISIERMKPKFPTNVSFVIFAMLNHESIHLGQLSAWRRVQGLGTV